ncbi:MAG: triose-phosphate isomerase [Bdellovibrionaceae bacterium]|nr:triose-phosphate isomerase [Pseudobdellovibrionaceae bacterium]
MKRPFVVAANWKMYKGPSEATAYLQEFLSHATTVPQTVSQTNKMNKVLFLVPAIDLWVVSQTLQGTAIGWGAQNCHFEKQGAFTGENSPAVIAELRTPYTLVGHSERRAIFGENDEMIAKKVRALQDVGIEPMLCVGETLAQREAGQTGDVIREQLREGLKLRVESKPFMVAYEPVWAIGTGKVASPQQANEAHQILRAELRHIGGDALAQSTPILYGGSVKPDNSAELAAQSEIDGFLVGGASLQVDSFLALARTKK